MINLKNKKISVVLPCRNEEKTVGLCIDKIRQALEGYNYEIIVSDSSKDRSPIIAKEKGAIVVNHGKVGYGNAYLEGFKAVTGDIVVVGDADNTYDFLEVPKLLAQMEKYDFVLGRRTYLHKGSMPALHRYIGNPGLSLVLRMLFGAKVMDTHSGLRVIKADKLRQLELRTTGMEFASEMIIKAVKHKLRIKEVPIHYYKRAGASKLRSFRDGWKHLRFMMLYSPSSLFFVPGIILFLLGITGLIALSAGSITINNFELGVHTAVFSSLLTILGFQLIFLTLFAKIYLFTILKEKQPFIKKIVKHFTLEKGLLIGAIVFIIGIIIGGAVVLKWLQTDFGGFFQPGVVILASTIVIIGLQFIFNVFYLSILGIERK